MKEHNTMHDKSLILTPYSWAKIQHCIRSMPTEVGFMGISSKDNPLLMEDFCIIKQEASVAFIDFDMADYDNQLNGKYCDPDGEFKLKPVNCQRVWLH